ncbi:hypothetical protein [Sphingomonas hankookensis]
MWWWLLWLYRLLSWPVTLTAQAATVVGMGFVMVGALRLLFAPLTAALTTIGTGAAIVAIAMAVWLALKHVEFAIDDRAEDA